MGIFDKQGVTYKEEYIVTIDFFNRVVLKISTPP